MNEKIVIIGGGGHAKVIINTLKKINQYEIIGYVSDNDNGELLGINFIGNDDVLSQIFYKGIINAALGIGQVKLTDKRRGIVNKLKDIGYYFPPILSPNAVVNSYVKVSEGVQILDGVVVNICSSIGKFSIINTNATIEHDCSIGDFCHIATGATLSGGVVIGNNSMIGSNAVVVQYKSVISETLIGSGGVVVNDISIPGTYVGNPVRRIN